MLSSHEKHSYKITTLYIGLQATANVPPFNYFYLKWGKSKVNILLQAL